MHNILKFTLPFLMISAGEAEESRKIKYLKSHIRTIPDFPKKGIQFRDHTFLLADAKAFRTSVDVFYKRYKDMQIEAVLGLESRGFIYGAALAHKLGVPFITVRKKGKLPGNVVRATYKKEYGEDAVEIAVGSLKKGQQVLVIDDLIATGGTAEAAIQLARKVGAKVVEVACLMEMPELKGREKISAPLYTLLKY